MSHKFTVNPQRTKERIVAAVVMIILIFTLSSQTISGMRCQSDHSKFKIHSFAN